MITATATTISAFIYTYEDKELCGLLKNDFLNRTVYFSNSWKMIKIMESIYDELSFPRASVNDKLFLTKNKKRDNSLFIAEDDMISEKKQKAKFIINVQYRQNATWQGTIQWVEENRTQNFRSTLEMLKLIDEALEDYENSPEQKTFKQG